MISYDNIIQLTFDKIFRQCTSNFQQLKLIPFSNIRSQTFENEFIYQLIHKLTHRPIDKIRSYLQDKLIQQAYLISKLKNKIDVEILFGDLDQILILIDKSYSISSDSLKLAVINGHLHIVKYLMSNSKIDHKFGTELLTLSAEFGHELLYMFLRELEFDPNIQTYNKSVCGTNIDIVQDVNTIIGLSKKTVELAFESGDTYIVEFIVKEAIESKIKISAKLISYVILNANIDLIKKISELIPIEWDPSLLHSAILSGSMEMITYVEEQIPNIHHNLTLDMSRIRKGQSDLLLESMIYNKNQTKYFSHTINYAVQSKSLLVLKYIHGIGYGITLSNIVNCIQTSTPEILTYLLQYYNKKIPLYIIHYFNIDAYCIDKTEFAKILIAYGFDISSKPNYTVSDYKLETTHLKLIAETKYVKPDLTYDTDYLLCYQSFFVPPTGFKLNRKLITAIRICAELKLETDFKKIINYTHHNIDKQFIMDTTYIFGEISYVKYVYELYRIIPSQSVIIETLCYGQIGKLSWLMQLAVLPDGVGLPVIMKEQIYLLSLSLDDVLINSFMCKLGLTSNPNSKLQAIINSGKSDTIISYINNNNQCVLDLDTIKQLCLLDDVELIDKINLVMDDKEELLRWLKENNLICIYESIINKYTIY